MKNFFKSIKVWACDFFPSLWRLFKSCVWAQIMVGIILLATILLTIREINYDKWYADSYTTPAGRYLDSCARAERARDSLKMVIDMDSTKMVNLEEAAE